MPEGGLHGGPCSVTLKGEGLRDVATSFHVEMIYVIS